ncbi:MAG TPA: HpcH/HpaI aldolase/citrate lyase family protein [Frankiaceae bacterium]|nr:HpcH/HpaI aldolase/citrate lyase family protein [Frankiaceae bacterium]
MRHFAHLSPAREVALFHCHPQEVDPSADRLTLATALGATLYAPGTRQRLADDARSQAARGVTSMVFCLEDAVADHELPGAEANVVAALIEMDGQPSLPWIFVRIRDLAQLRRLLSGPAGGSSALAGVVLPKFSAACGGGALLAEVESAGQRLGRRLWAMPVLESPEIIYNERRLEALTAIRELVDAYQHIVLALRVGATDLCGLYGLRRDRDLTIYDIAVVRDCLADIVNVCARDAAHVVTGPVWEYFANAERLFVSPLRVTPFEQAHESELRQSLVSRDHDRLIREVVLDKANGLLGKTVIHPSHVPAVHALMVVTHEEYTDACIVMDGDAGGVRRSDYGNKMNELRPHRAWAQVVLRRAHAFGVLRAGHTFVDVLAAQVESEPAPNRGELAVPRPVRRMASRLG